MARDSFFDTNVLIYAFAADDARNATAKAVVTKGGVISVQVANEFVDVSRRRWGWTWEDVADALDSLRGLLGAPFPLTDDTHRLALAMSRRHGFRIYDSLIVAAAHAAGCSRLYTEDLQHGRVIDGVRIENPFLQP